MSNEFKVRMDLEISDVVAAYIVIERNMLVHMFSFECDII